MRVDVVVGTYGHPTWMRRGQETARACADLLADRGWAFPVHGDTLAEARNEGAVVARGDWLCFVDADDRLAPDYFQAMADAARPGSLLVPAVQREHADRVEAPTIPNTRPRRPLIEINRAVIGTLIERDLFLQVGGFGDEPIYEDWALWVRCVDAGAQIVEVPGAVYVERVSGDGGRNLGPEVDRHRVYWATRRRYERPAGEHPELSAQ